VRTLITTVFIAALCIGGGVSAIPALAQDDMGDLARDSIGVPLPPKDAAGTWTLEGHGHSICHVTLSADLIGPKLYGLQIPADCVPSLPAGIAGWESVVGGMVMVDSGGHVLADFDNWSPELLVSRRSHLNVQLRRTGG